ncbi:MAG: hypothetical protein AAFN93_23065 [Bacteroidota bacterium]
MVNIKVVEILDISKSSALDIISDFHKYDNWWVIPVKVINSEAGFFEFRPLPFIRIGIELTERKSDSEVQFDYVKGPFRGYGIWKFKELEKDKTEISYEIFLMPTNLIYKLVSSTRIFAKKHVKDIKTIIKRIKEEAS